MPRPALRRSGIASRPDPASGVPEGSCSHIPCIRQTHRCPVVPGPPRCGAVRDGAAAPVAHAMACPCRASMRDRRPVRVWSSSTVRPASRAVSECCSRDARFSVRSVRNKSASIGSVIRCRFVQQGEVLIHGHSNSPGCPVTDLVTGAALQHPHAGMGVDHAAWPQDRLEIASSVGHTRIMIRITDKSTMELLCPLPPPGS
jgi:hypothetical protein